MMRGELPPSPFLTFHGEVTATSKRGHEILLEPCMKFRFCLLDVSVFFNTRPGLGLSPNEDGIECSGRKKKKRQVRIHRTTGVTSCATALTLYKPRRTEAATETLYKPSQGKGARLNVSTAVRGCYRDRQVTPPVAATFQERTLKAWRPLRREDRSASAMACSFVANDAQVRLVFWNVTRRTG